MGEGGGVGSLPSANPDNVAAGGATDARCGGEGGRGVAWGRYQLRATPTSLFLLVFLSAVRPAGGSMKNSAFGSAAHML